MPVIVNSTPYTGSQPFEVTADLLAFAYYPFTIEKPKSETTYVPDMFFTHWYISGDYIDPSRFSCELSADELQYDCQVWVDFLNCNTLGTARDYLYPETTFTVTESYRIHSDVIDI